MDNFNNRIQNTVATKNYNGDGDTLVFHASVRGQVRRVRLVHSAASVGNVTANHLVFQLVHLSGTTETNIGDAYSTEANAAAKGDIVEIVNFDSARLELEQGDSLLINATETGTATAQFAVAVDFEVIGSD